MRFFTCVLDPAGTGISNRARRDYEALPRERGLQFQWRSFRNAAVLTAWDEAYGESLFALGDGWFAVGAVRLDNRPDVERLLPGLEMPATDLEIVGTCIAEHGIHVVSQLLGDFGFIVWHHGTRTAVAACDTFAVQKLYYAEHDRLVAFSSRAESLARNCEYDIRYLIERSALRPISSGSTVYAGIRVLPPATTAAIAPQRPLSIQQYWNPHDHDVDRSLVRAADEASDMCRYLLAESIRLRMGGTRETWAQLSGGMDSSSVVSCAQWLAQRGVLESGLAGTITFVEQRGSGTDEREYSNAVVDRWKIPNVTIVDAPTWYDPAFELPHLDQPDGSLQVYPRDRRQCLVIRNAGGRVLLTGMGGDQLFAGTMLFFADWIVRGRVRPALREMARRAALGRVSFWRLAYRNAMLPMLPRYFHRRLVHDQDQVPEIPWLRKDAMKRAGLDARQAVSMDAYNGRLGHKYEYAAAWMVSTIENHYYGGIVADLLDVRHPLLYRPLVEFALQLPQELRARPHEHRRILRQAMNGILPERVRKRVGKPGTGDYLSWSVRSNQRRLASLIHEPVLADLGVIDPAQLRTTFLSVLTGTGDAQLCGPLLDTLAVEAWLRIRSGRWPFDSQSCN